VLALRDRLDDRGVLRYRFLHADGTYRWIEDQTNVIRNPEGDPTEIVGSWIDVTYLKIMADEKDRLQEQFHQAQKMEAIGALAGGVAHDFSNILMAILSYSESLLMQLPEDSSLRHEAQEIRRAGNRAAALTHQLLAFSRKQATSPQLLNPAEAVRSLSRMISRLIGDNIVVSLDLHTDAGYILCDPTHLDQVLINLILNARDAMPQGGKITVGVREAADGTQDNGFCLWVADTGVGIPPENVARIFDPFFTTKPQGKGTGLGLATVYGVVKQNGGRIEVESHPEVGTTFRIFFARHTAAALDAAATPHGTASATRALTVLLAEDNEPVRNATARLLVGLGHVVVAVESGERAREVFSGKPDSIDLLVSDVVMPGMGGAELLRELRALRPELRAVFCTGYPDDLDLLEREHTTTEPVVHKPFDRETLARAIRTALAGPPVG
jgi:signal transduction histidine kinase/CheY-like chemotaxis protein